MDAMIGAETPVSASGTVLPTRRSATCIDCGGPRSKLTKSTGGRCRKCCYEPRKRTMPDDFVAVAATMNAADLARHYGCSTGKISEWFAAAGMSRTSASRFAPAAQPPANFAELTRSCTIRELMAATGRGECVVKRWLAEMGLTSRRVLIPTVFRTNRMPIQPVNRDCSHAGLAANFLRKWGPVYRCTLTGSADVKGTHWSRNGHVLTDAEVIERADRNGWQPDAWRKIAA